MLNRHDRAHMRVLKDGTAVIGSQDVDCTFDAEPVYSDDGLVLGTRPTLACLLVDLPAVDEGDTLEYPKGSGTSYTIAEILDPSGGAVILRLEAL